MRQTAFITQSPSISVIQGAYIWICAKQSDGDSPAGAMVAYGWEKGTCQWFLLTVPEMVHSAEDWLKFDALVTEWRSERSATSSVMEMTMQPAYQKIIGMGEKAIPFIISTLRADGDEPDHWFWALRVLTGLDPVKDGERGDIVRMAQAWLRWAEETYGW